jgi:hypothetical protein
MSEAASNVRNMLIDCDTCSARPDACADCVVAYLTIETRDQQAGTRLTPAEFAAIDVLVQHGLAAPLRRTGT